MQNRNKKNQIQVNLAAILSIIMSYHTNTLTY